MRDARAYAPLCRLIGESEEAIEFLGDAETETLDGILINVCDGDPQPLMGAIESEGGDEFARVSALKALGWLDARAGDSQRRRDARLSRAAAARNEAARRIVSVATWAETAANLGYDDMRSEVASLHAKGWVDPAEFGLNHFDQQVKLARNDPAGLAGFEADGVTPFEKAIETLASWSYGDDARTGGGLRARTAGTDYESALRQSAARRRPQRSVPLRERQEIQALLPGGIKSGARRATAVAPSRSGDEQSGGERAWVRWRASRSSKWRASARRPSPACCSPTWARTSCASTASRRPRATRSTPSPAARSLDRGRRSIALDLKKPEAVAAALELVAGADALIEGFRPGVMERLGLGPDVCLARNPRLVFGRVTGWGQEGPLAETAGHDIDYIALTGALHAIGAKDAPAPPLNLHRRLRRRRDVSRLRRRLRARRGARFGARAGRRRGDDRRRRPADGDDLQLKASGLWRGERQANVLDGGAPFYGVYRCADGKWVAVGALEPQFFAALVDKLGLDGRRVRRPLGSPRLAGDEGAARSGLRRTVARRMGGAVRRFRRLRRARPRSRRGPRHPHNSRAGPSSTSTARRSRRPRRASRARRLKSAARPRGKASTARRSCARAVFRGADRRAEAGRGAVNAPRASYASCPASSPLSLSLG